MRVDPAMRAKILELAGELPSLAADLDETAFQQAVTDLAGRFGWGWHHQTISKRSKSGWPDLTLWRDRVLFRELKAEGGVVSAAQATCLEGLQAAGADAGVWRPRDWPLIVQTLSQPPAFALAGKRVE